MASVLLTTCAVTDTTLPKTIWSAGLPAGRHLSCRELSNALFGRQIQSIRIRRLWEVPNGTVSLSAHLANLKLRCAPVSVARGAAVQFTACIKHS